jgi:glycosyltransferase involved in cell wall biosynthesis
MTYRTAVFKLKVELVIMLPFTLLGKLIGKLFPLKPRRNIFLFFPSADIGGSIKVNADITQCIKDQKPVIIFSKEPKNNEFRSLFEIEDVKIIDLHKYIDNKLYHFVNFFFRGVIASWVNSANDPVIFGGESLFFYKIVPHVKKETRRIDLCHLNTWINYSLAFAKYLDLRIFSTPKIKRDVEYLYRRNHLPQLFFDKLVFIDNKVNIPPLTEIKNDRLEVVYVGRDAPQKRVHLIAEIAKQMHKAGDAAHFSFVGDVKNAISADVKEYVTLYGNVRQQEALHKIYVASDVLILTSAYEGLPIVIMDMMARGKIVISTAVDGIPDYITNMENGLLITEKEELKIIQQAIELLRMLITKPELKREIGIKSYQYAIKHFSGETFCQLYRKILIGS